MVMFYRLGTGRLSDGRGTGHRETQKNNVDVLGDILSWEKKRGERLRLGPAKRSREGLFLSQGVRRDRKKVVGSVRRGMVRRAKLGED